MNKDLSRNDYILRINKVIDYIHKNLDKKLSLEKLSMYRDLSQ